MQKDSYLLSCEIKSIVYGKLKSQPFLLICFIFIFFAFGCAKKEYKAERRNIVEDRTTVPGLILAEMDAVLKNNLLANWYPRCIDTVHGGFLSDFNADFQPNGPQIKMIVTQARHIWSLSQVIKNLDMNDSLYLTACKNGMKFMKDYMWDKKLGGFYSLVKREGEVTSTDYFRYKTLYGNVFAIYGLAAYYEVSHDKEALETAKQTFDWLEECSYDPEFGGYFQFIDDYGNAIKNGENGVPPKDQNSSIHVLEALTELYSVWPDAHLKSRIEEMISVLRDKIVDEKGYLHLFFEKDWTPVKYTDEKYQADYNKYEYDYISFGHDVEVAYLITEAMEVIDEVDPVTVVVCKKIVDHSLATGFDESIGVLPDAGYYFSDTVTIINPETQWWAAAEATNSFLLMASLYPDDANNYYDKFTLSWDYCKNYLIDYERGGWYRIGINSGERFKNENKGSIWKGTYHNARALFNCMARLKEMDNLN